MQENNIPIYDTYADDGFSGTNFERPDFKRILGDLEKHKANSITGISSKFLYTLSPPFFAHRLAQIACKPFLVLVRRSYSVSEQTRQFLLTALPDFSKIGLSYRNAQVNTQKP